MGMPKSNIVPLAMNDQMLSRKIAEVAKDSSRVFVTDHAKKRMRQRGILRTQVDKVLMTGKVVEHAHRNIHGNWQCTLEAIIAGDRIKIPVALEDASNGDSIIVITVMN